MNPEDILTPDQLAERLRVKVTWVYKKNRRRGQYTGDPMPRLRLGRYLRFYWPDICRGCAIRGTIIDVKRILTFNDKDFSRYTDSFGRRVWTSVDTGDGEPAKLPVQVMPLNPLEQGRRWTAGRGKPGSRRGEATKQWRARSDEWVVSATQRKGTAHQTGKCLVSLELSS